MKAEDVIRTNVDFLLTETLLDSKISLDRLMEILKDRRTTGQLTVHISEGGRQRITLTEKTRATDVQREKIREVLGMQ